MSADAITITLPRPRIRRGPLVALACTVAGALATAGVMSLTSHSAPVAPRPHVYTAPAHAFTLAVPPGWRSASDAQLARTPGAPLAVLRSADGRAAVVVQQTGRVAGTPQQVTKQLTASLSRRFRPFAPLAARPVQTRAGAGYLYVFGHGTAVQSLAIVAAAGRDYTINGIVASGAADRAREVGAIVASFGP